MKRALLFFLLLLAAVAWWAVERQPTEAIVHEVQATPAAYPVDFAQRLARIQKIQLELNAHLPDGIVWQTAAEHPEIGNLAARKGGRVRFPNAGPFPAHFLRFGGTVQFFQQNLLAATEIPLVARHPLTDQPTAGMAEAWATVGNTFYFRLNPAARYNNGCPVRAADYLLAALLQAEQHCSEFELLAQAATSLKTHGDHLLSITLRMQSDAASAAQLLHPAEPGFYRDFDSRFRESYAQRIPPATGPYRVSRVERGRMLELQRICGWWGEQLPLCRNRFNADFIEHHFLQSEAQVWEFLLRGKLDALQTRNIAAWQEHTASADHLPTLVYDAEYPLPPYGIALNARTLSSRDLRRGLMHAMDMDKAMQIIMRGEGSRLTTFSSGYGALTPQNTPQYQYNPATARDLFAKAGYTQPGSDGILRTAEGTRLSVRLSYTPSDKISTLVACLVQSAAACGAEIVPEPLPWQNCQRQLQERSHELIFWAVPAPEKPDPARFLAAEAEPDFSPFGIDSPAIHSTLEHYRTTPNAEALAAVDKAVYEEAIWLPGWKENRVYLMHHPHLQIPESRWCYDAADAHLFWRAE